MIIEALEDTCNSHAWVHYVWWEPGSFYPVPKSSCHFRVYTPQGEDLIVGGGMNYPPEEKEYASIIVDTAVKRIEKEGENTIDVHLSLVQQCSWGSARLFYRNSTPEHRTSFNPSLPILFPLPPSSR